ncbi:MAG: hypothetical protein HRT88_11305 [Lentisphaeraceae bacterium]|nr:hypothetical protein [Lentisphaeraceae bacterium]
MNKKYLYILKLHHEDQQLFELEQKYFFHRENKDERYFLSDDDFHLEETTFGEAQIEILASSEDFNDLGEQLRATLPTLLEAKIEAKTIGFLPKCGFQDILRLLPYIKVHANLKNPQNIYVLTRTENHWFFGKKISSSSNAWVNHRKKPLTMSSAIPHILARTMVFTLKSMGCKTFIDYCCGSGTFLIEASSIGLQCTGTDSNENMCDMSIANLKHFSYKAAIEVADATKFSQKTDGAVVDFPYGFSCARDESEEDKIIANVSKHADISVFVCGQDLTHKFTERGLEIIEQTIIPAVNVKRHIFFIRKANV